MADVFVDATSRGSIVSGIGRFIDLVFANPFETPNADEMGMYFARAAALRSADLSRQVGAVIMGEPGQVLGIGCNEVPKPGGGHYWPGDEKDLRDFVLGYDPNTKIKIEMVAEIFHILQANGWLSKGKTGTEIDELVSSAIKGQEDAILKDSQITNVIEFGRIVHAEMSAITEAARRGSRLEGATLYCTTFPCHICARHIISSGIARVVYIEPYPKSMAQRLYPEAIITDGRNSPGREVRFDPFIGVSPSRYSDLFEMPGRRKDSDGNAVKWKRNTANPRLEQMIESHIGIETFAIGTLEGGLKRADLKII